MVETAPIFVGDVVWMRLFRKQLTSASSMYTTREHQFD